jgi:hypothetical protein
MNPYMGTGPLGQGESLSEGGSGASEVGRRVTPTDKRTPYSQQMYRHSESLCTGAESPACNSLSVSYGPTGASTERLRGF